MKPPSVSKTNFQSIPLGYNWNSANVHNFDNPFSFQEFSVPQPMPQQEIAPPPHLWDKIANVLDEQDRLKAEAHASILRVQKKSHPNYKYLFYIAVGMLATIIIYVTSKVNF